MFTLLDCFALLAGFAVARGKEELPNPNQDAAVLLLAALFIAATSFFCGEIQSGFFGFVGLAASFGIGYGYGFKTKEQAHGDANATPLAVEVNS